MIWILVACSGGDSAPPQTQTDTDDLTADTSVTTDSSTTGSTAATADTAVEPMVPLAGFGDISGDCDVLDPKVLVESEALRFRTTLDVGKTPFDAELLSVGGQEIIEEGGLNEGSLNSEAIAFDLLHRCELATLLRTESEVVYADANGKKTDVLVEIDGTSVGVSVTRGFTFPKCAAPGDLGPLLQSKIDDAALAQANALSKNAWSRTILSIVACDQAHADAIETAWDATPPTARGEVIVMVIQTDGDDSFLY